MLQIEELKVEVGGKPILKNINMEIPKGETHILFGPNGSGKTSLMMTLMGFSGYRVTHGKITFKGEDVTHMPMHERARLGIGVMFQRPPTINGLKTRDIVKICGNGRPVNVDELAQELQFSDFLDRDVNQDFSGGEIKRSEIASPDGISLMPRAAYSSSLSRSPAIAGSVVSLGACCSNKSMNTPSSRFLWKRF